MTLPPAAVNLSRIAAESPHFVFLVPGFFGFTNLGDMPYFSRVEDLLAERLAWAGLPSRVISVHTHPTASVRSRAVRLLDAIVEAAPPADAGIHIVGHSTGGLDARLLTTPGVSLPTEHDVEALARRVKTVVCLSTPHRGTPLAALFTGLMGPRMLQLFSLGTILTFRFGRLPIHIVAKLAGLMWRLQKGTLRSPSPIEEMHRQLLSNFKGERRATIERFFGDVREEQGLLLQLAPDGMDMFNASTQDRPGVRYGSVLTAARSPSVRSTLAAGLDPYAQATHGLFALLFRISSQPMRSVRDAAEAIDATLERAFGEPPAKHLSDGVVPTRSQPWGEIVHATRADHLDTVGYFGDPNHEPPHHDWLCSGSDFRRPHFERLWSDVARFIAAP